MTLETPGMAESTGARRRCSDRQARSVRRWKMAWHTSAMIHEPWFTGFDARSPSKVRLWIKLASELPFRQPNGAGKCSTLPRPAIYSTPRTKPRWRNWQTRQLEVLVGVKSLGGSSPLLGIGGCGRRLHCWSDEKRAARLEPPAHSHNGFDQNPGVQALQFARSRPRSLPSTFPSRLRSEAP